MARTTRNSPRSARSSRYREPSYQARLDRGLAPLDKPDETGLDTVSSPNARACAKRTRNRRARYAPIPSE